MNKTAIRFEALHGILEDKMADASQAKQAGRQVSLRHFNVRLEAIERMRNGPDKERELNILARQVCGV